MRTFQNILETIPHATLTQAQSQRRMCHCLEEIIDVNEQCLHFASKATPMCHAHHHQTTQQALLTASQPCQPDDSTVVSSTAGGFCQHTGTQIGSGQVNRSTVQGFGFSPWHFVPAAIMPGRHPASLFSSSVPIQPTNNDKASNNKPLLRCGRGCMCHNQISQGLEDEPMMHAHSSFQEYNQGNTTILSNGRSPTKGQFHWAVTAGLPYTKIYLRPLPQTDANGRSYLRGGSQGSGAAPKSFLLAHQFNAVSLKSGNSKLVSGSEESH